MGERQSVQQKHPGAERIPTRGAGDGAVAPPLHPSSLARRTSSQALMMCAARWPSQNPEQRELLFPGLGKAGLTRVMYMCKPTANAADMQGARITIKRIVYSLLFDWARAPRSLLALFAGGLGRTHPALLCPRVTILLLLLLLLLEDPRILLLTGRGPERCRRPAPAIQCREMQQRCVAAWRMRAV
jgi:hypothetical protein